jgi:hypothetical protein
MRNFIITAFIMMLIIPAAAEEGNNTFGIKGFVESENIISTYKDQELPDIFKKNEIHSRIELRYGSEDIYGMIISHQYAMSSAINKDYPYSTSFKVTRNGRISGKNYEMNINEAYINATFPAARLRAGNQVYGWGTADVFNPTSYFNPMDLREFIFRDEDERVFGIPSVSAMWFIGSFTLETVFVPFQVASEIQTGANYWAIKDKKGPFPLIVDNPDPLSVKTQNAGYGMRFSGTFFGIDASASAYYGPDREPLMRPVKTVIEPDKPVSILIEPEYRMTAAAGFDMSANLDPFVIQGEVCYAPYRFGVVDQPYDANISLPFDVERNETLTYTIGGNYFIPFKKIFPWHTGTAVLTAEWMQIINSNSAIMDPLLTDIISTRFEDTFFDDSLKFSVTMMIDTYKNGMSIFPKAAWDFQNGLSLDISYVYIKGSNGSVFGYFDDNDHVSVRCRYAF